jgi:hypothetical protein
MKDLIEIDRGIEFCNGMQTMSSRHCVGDGICAFPTFLTNCEAVISLTQKQIRKYAKEHLGTFFLDGVFCNFFIFPLAPKSPKYANMQIRTWPLPPHLSVK